MLPISVAADQLAYVFATGAITSADDLLIDEVLQVLRQPGNAGVSWQICHRANCER